MKKLHDNKITFLYDAKDEIIKEVTTNNKVNIYVCGPTTYDHIHIGNLRPIVFYDLVVRYLEYKNNDVNYVMNITDIDDKIIEKFLDHQDKYLNELVLSQYYTLKFIELFDVFNFRKPNVFPKVSDNITEMLDFIKILEQKDLTYSNETGIYFKVNSIQDYGKLSKRELLNNLNNHEEHKHFHKENTEDFALWKKTNEGMKFESNWGEGRPGWHTECALFIYKYFNHESINIHGGGIDLKFPHHENERAQYNALTKKELSNIYSYVGHVMFDKQKMSKSLGNFRYVKDLIEIYDVNVIKYFLIFSSYKKPLNFTSDILEQNQKIVQKITNLIRKINLKDNWEKIQTIEFNSITDDMEELNQFISCVDNDFNMQNAQDILIKLISKINQSLKKDDQIDSHLIAQLKTILKIINLEF